MSSFFSASCSLCECGCGDGQCGWECDCSCCKPGVVPVSLSLSPLPTLLPCAASVLVLPPPSYKLVVVDADGYETASPWVSMEPCKLLTTVMGATICGPALTTLRQGLLEFCSGYLPQDKALLLSQDFIGVAAMLLSSSARRGNKCYMLSL